MKQTIKKIFPQAARIASYYFEGKRWVRVVRLSMASRERRFTNIYHGNKWSDLESQSGPGSNLAETEVIRRVLPELIRKLSVKSVVDAPCGDFNWMKTLDLQIESYTGVDIVADMVETNDKAYAGLGRKFLHLDICHDSLPGGDLIICRDGLVHLSFSDIARALDNFRASGSTYLLTTVFPELSDNRDIVTGMWRPLNFCVEPFCFPEPVRLIEEQSVAVRKEYGKKCLGLWPLAQLPGFKT